MSIRVNLSQVFCLGLVVWSLSGCSTLRTVLSDGGDAVGSAGGVMPREEPRSRYGNPESYEVFGKRYHVMESTRGYVERGIASWYGKKFHGRRTSSGETYDMYAISAAHKTLPLPTYVEVRVLQTGKRLVLRVNDRGPFVEGRIIDLSYAAAKALGIVSTGTAEVEVRAVFADGKGNLPNMSRSDDITDSESSSPPWRELDSEGLSATPTASGSHSEAVYIEVGIFSELKSAEKFQARLLGGGIERVLIHDGATVDGMYLVWIGPFGVLELADRVLERLDRLGVGEYRLVAD